VDSLLSLTSWLATRDRAVLKLAIRHARCSNTHTQTLYPRQEAVSNDGRMTLTRETANCQACP